MLAYAAIGAAAAVAPLLFDVQACKDVSGDGQGVAFILSKVVSDTCDASSDISSAG
jgi:hypothetical protein